MKVLIVNRYMGIYGGAETVVKQFASRLHEMGIKNLVLTLNISDEVRRICKDIEVVTPQARFPYAFRSSSFLSSLGIFREAAALRHLVKKYAKDFDVINVHNFPADWAVWGLQQPVVWFCNEIPDFYNNHRPSAAVKIMRACGIAFDRWVVNNLIDNICVADESNAQRLYQRYGRKSTIIPYGIDLDIFTSLLHHRAGFRQRYGIEKDELVLLQVGVLSPEKNQLESINALKKLCDNGYQARLFLVGTTDTAYKNVLTNYIQKHGLTANVVFIGQVSKEIVAQFYNSADVCLFPVKTQGGWLAPFEALSCARPVLVSATMGAAVLIKQQELAKVSHDFVQDIISFVEQIDFWQSRATSASLWIKDNLTWANFTNRMVRVFEQSLADQAD